MSVKHLEPFKATFLSSHLKIQNQMVYIGESPFSLHESLFMEAYPSQHVLNPLSAITIPFIFCKYSIKIPHSMNTPLIFYKYSTHSHSLSSIHIPLIFHPWSMIQYSIRMPFTFHN